MGLFSKIFKAVVGVTLVVAGFITGNPALILQGAGLIYSAARSTSGPARQAAVMQLTLGEGPREAIFGRAATGGTLLDAYNFGGKYKTDYELVMIKVADHQCDALEGYYIGDTYYPYTAEGLQPGFNNHLAIYWMDGAPGQALHAFVLSTSATRLYGQPWTADDRCASMAVFIAVYLADNPKADNPVWPQGRPSFKPVVRGKRCYDPRLDSTVAGGSGAHRWDVPSTWAWTENAAICDYNYDRGIYAEDQVGEPKHLLVGRGLTALEAPPERVAVRANLCDEDVALKAPPAAPGATEKRYRANGVIFANETFIEVKQKFADAMGGDIVKREGGVEVLPGVAHSVVLEITDADLVVGEQVSFEPFGSDVDRVNTVIPRYIAPDQIYKNHAAPARRSTAAILDDGGQKVLELDLDLVTSHSQAQRVGEIRRRMARKEIRAAIVLSPIHSELEDGDWIGWTSARYLNGGRVVFRVEAYGVQQDWRTTLVLREIASTCFDWVAATDEGTPGQAPVDEAGSLPAVELDNVDMFGILKTGASGNRLPAVRAIWDAPPDPAILTIRAELREVGSLEVAPTLIDHPESGLADIMNGVGPDQLLEGRLVPLGVPGRKFIPSDWILITSLDLSPTGLWTFLWTIPVNLTRFDMWTPAGGTTAIGVPPDPAFTAFGTQQMAWRMPGGGSAELRRVGATYNRVDQDGFAVYSLMANVALNSGTGTIRIGAFQAGTNTPVPGIASQSFALSTTPAVIKWEGVSSSDPAFTSVEFCFFQEPGDLSGGQSADITDIQQQYNAALCDLPWRPSPDEDDLPRYIGVIEPLFEAARASHALHTIRVTPDSQAYEYATPGPVSVRAIA